MIWLAGTSEGWLVCCIGLRDDRCRTLNQSGRWAMSQLDGPLSKRLRLLTRF